MPWQFTTPVNVGDLDSGPYTQCRITRMTHDSVRAFLTLDLEYGNTVSSVWTPGVAPRSKQTNAFISGQDYDDLVTNATPNAGPPVEKTYEASKRALYEYLQTKNIIAAGTLV